MKLNKENLLYVGIGTIVTVVGLIGKQKIKEVIDKKLDARIRKVINEENNKPFGFNKFSSFNDENQFDPFENMSFDSFDEDSDYDGDKVNNNNFGDGSFTELFGEE